MNDDTNAAQTQVTSTLAPENAPQTKSSRRALILIAVALALGADLVFFGDESFFGKYVWTVVSKLLAVLDQLPRTFWRLWIIGGTFGWVLSLRKASQKDCAKGWTLAAWLLPGAILVPGVAMFFGVALETAFLWTVVGTIALGAGLLFLGLAPF
jgi:hypothetical protein